MYASSSAYNGIPDYLAIRLQNIFVELHICFRTQFSSYIVNGYAVQMQLERKDDLWKPEVLILNNDNLIVKKSVLEFFPESGLARNILTLTGSISNGMSLRYFPVGTRSVGN